MQRIAELRIEKRENAAMTTSESKKKTKKTKKAMSGETGKEPVRSQTLKKPQSNGMNGITTQNKQFQSLQSPQNYKQASLSSNSQSVASQTHEADSAKPKKKKKKTNDGFKVVRKGSNAASFAKNAKISTSYSMFYDPYESEEEEMGENGRMEGNGKQRQNEQTSLDSEIATSMMMDTDEWTG